MLHFHTFAFLDLYRVKEQWKDKGWDQRYVLFIHCWIHSEIQHHQIVYAFIRSDMLLAPYLFISY